jgi:hypothetical protein
MLMLGATANSDVHAYALRTPTAQHAARVAGAPLNRAVGRLHLPAHGLRSRLDAGWQLPPCYMHWYRHGTDRPPQ